MKGTIIEIDPSINKDKLPIYMHTTKENIINFELYKKYQIIVVIC